MRKDVDGRVAEIAAEVLGSQVVSTGRLEADSLELVELSLALEERIGVRLPDDAIYETLAEVAAAVAQGGQSSDRLGNGFGRLQRVAETAFRVPLRGVYRLTAFGAEHLPGSGPAILASNHDSLLDIPCLVVASPRPVWFMAKVELFRGRAASGLLHRLGGFPVRRDRRDVRAVQTALEVLRRGRVLGMYPEGTRAAHLQPFLPGAAWLSLATGAPIVPAGVSGTAEAMPKGSRLPRRTRISVRFGEPIESGRQSDPRARLKRAREVTNELRSVVGRLLDQ
ncbi:MAG TPA: 1-acyl-sn-glycerol-3-phosphate acyltransferase [Actinomycetota bacterium]|nr:1-acyl-sn-glycerol-3-phosphate acyltransferase [Actinomycetota bacterium]